MFVKRLHLLAVAAALCMASSAHAAFLNPAGPWSLPANGGTYLDFELAPGSSGTINLYVQSNDPNATVYLGAPNEVYASGIYDNFGTLINEQYVGVPTFTWNEVVSAGHTIINWTTSANFNFCSSVPSDFHGVCAQTNYFWGNADALTVTSKAAAIVSTSPFTTAPSAVPEPGAWVLMLAGFVGLGAALRRLHRYDRPALG